MESPPAAGAGRVRLPDASARQADTCRCRAGGVPTGPAYWKPPPLGQPRLAAYASAKAIAITTYNTIFNSSPKLDQPAAIVFDDAHAGEQYVASRYTIEVRRSDEADYHRLLSRDLGIQTRLHEALGALQGDNSFTYTMIRSGLAACLVYVSYGSISVRPLIPPTNQNAVFTNAAQRIYLSATLGEGGELERAFGRAPITRLALPEKSAAPRAGRRFFVLPQLSSPSSAEEVATALVATARKALVLTQDQKSADRLLQGLQPDGFPVFQKADIEDGFDAFKAAPEAICSRANRYDGIDLPGHTCRMVILAGLRTPTLCMSGSWHRGLESESRWRSASAPA